VVTVPRRQTWSAFEAFFQSSFMHTRAVLILALGDVELAEEAAQEAFVRALAHWHRLDKHDQPERWIYVVALNFARDTLRRRQRSGQMIGPSDTIGFDERIDDRMDITRALRELPYRQRQVVVLRYLADLTTAETAKAMGCAEGTVRAALHAAVKRIGESIGEMES
jgi:RNA polymerase sigma factor (sigma-70 family)